MYTASLELFDQNPFQPEKRHTEADGLTYSRFILEDLAPSILAYKNSRPSTLGLLQLPAARAVVPDGTLFEFPADLPANGDLTDFLHQHGARLQLAYGDGRYKAFEYLSGSDLAYGTLPFELVYFSNEEMATTAWIENHKRDDLNPMERYEMVSKMIAAFGWNQAQTAEKLELSAPTVSNILTLGELPQEIQKRLRAREITERQAASLIPYYRLPEPLREAAAKKTYVDNPEKFAREGRSSDEIRNAVKNMITQTAIILPDAYLAETLEGPGVLAATCTTCANHFMHNTGHYCGEQTRSCFNAKKEAGKRAVLAEASQLTGVPILENNKDYKVLYQIMENSPTHLASLHPTSNHPGILAQGCEHLRLRLDNTALKRESLFDNKFHNVVGVVCCNPTGECACAKAMHQARAEQQEHAPQTGLTPQQEAQAQRERHLEAFRATFLNPTAQAILPLILSNDVGFWRMIVFKMTSLSPDQAEQLSLEQCQAEIAERIAWTRISPYEIQNNPDGALATLNFTRARLGLEPLTMPEDPHATPADKLMRRLERIESWLERCAEGADEMTSQAAEGNLANLDKIKREYAALPESDTDRDFFVRINIHIENLSAWLDAYDAESDEDEDEEEDDLQEDEEEDFEEAYA